MTEAAEPIEGHCLCGAVAVRVARPPGWVGACHCRMCQRWTGGLFLCFPAEGVTVAGPVTRYRSSSFAERGFCTICGSHLWMRNLDVAEGQYELMPGLFDAACLWPLKSEIYTDRALASVQLTGAERRATRADYEQTNLHVEGDAP